MNDEQKVFESGRLFAAKMGDFLKATEIMGRIGNVKQAIMEAESRLRRLQNEASKMQFELEAARTVQEDARLIIAKANAEGRDIVMKARAETSAAHDTATKIVDEAVAEAERIKEAARRGAHDDAKRALKEYDEKFEVASKKVKARATELDELTDKIAERKRTLDTFNAALKAVKDKIG